MAQSTLSQSPASQASASVHKKRLDIQGLRAIAVIAVIFDHLLHWPSGGFVGVDVFFVISGFLITGLLLREHDKTGTISFRGFYIRRVRRIIPAAATVLAFTAAASYVVFNHARAQQTTTDAIWSFFFSANWHFAAVGTDYFQSTGPVSPLQHFWSLAVEEQFYFVWPWLMLLIFFLGGRSSKWDTSRAHKAIAIAMSLIVAVSFAWALVDTMVSPTVAYFSTFSRAWELGVGALVAVFASVFERIPHAVRPVLAWMGLAGIVWSVFNISTSMAFPAPWAAAPVFATALVIVAGTGGQQRFLWPLTNKVASYVGDISYSLYLWHFPVVILLASLVKEDSPLYIPLAVVLMAGLSVAAYHLIEKRVLAYYTPEAEFARRKRRNQGRPPFKKSTQIAALIALALVTAGVTTMALVHDRMRPVEAPIVVAAQPSASPGAEPLADTSLPKARAAAVTNALAASAWPKLTPDVSELASKGRAGVSCEYGPKDDVPSSGEVLSNCVNGDPKAIKVAVLIGDSYAAALSPGVIDALTPQGYKVIVLTKNSCPAISIRVKLSDGSAYPGCDDFQSFLASEISTLRPDLVLISGWHGQVIDRLASGATGAAALAEWKTALTKSATSFAASSKAVTVIAGPPTGRNLQECATPFSKPQDCVAPISGEYKNFSAAEQAGVTAANSPAIKYVPMVDWFCAADKCPPFIGANPVYVDGGHLTNTAAKALAPLLKQSLLG